MRQLYVIMQQLNYNHVEIVTQEVPDEIALAISISGCPLACPGCHSAHTWNPNLGSPLDVSTLNHLISSHKHVSCVLFYDGLHIEPALLSLFQATHKAGLKVAFYTGLETVSPELAAHIDYLKVGPYIAALGGLNSPTTNQRMYHNNIDITSQFYARFNS